MKAAASLVLAAVPDEAGARAAEEAAESLDGVVPALAVMFATPHYVGRTDALLTGVQSVVGRVPLIGCVAGSVVGGSHEVESQAAVSLWLAGETGPVETFSMGYMKTRNGGLYGGYRFQEDGGLHLLVCDPQTFPAGELLEHLNQNVPGTHVAGGMASAGGTGRGAHMFLDGKTVDSGAVGARLTGVAADVVVSQGCRPIGSPYTVTRAEGNVMHELGGRPPFERLKEIVATLSEPERELLANGGLQLGRVIDEYRPEQRRGDFLVRRVVGADPDTGAIVVGDELEVGQTVQFHVRDAESADQDLREALEREVTTLAGRGAAGALLFTCNGRGSRLFSTPDHDAGLVAKLLGEVPAGGFSCAGELGPVGGKNFLHGFTASVAIFR